MDPVLKNDDDDGRRRESKNVAFNGYIQLGRESHCQLVSRAAKSRPPTQSTWTTRLRSSLVEVGRCHARRRDSAVCNERGRPPATARRACNGGCTSAAIRRLRSWRGLGETFFFAAPRSPRSPRSPRRVSAAPARRGAHARALGF